MMRQEKRKKVTLSKTVDREKKLCYLLCRYIWLILLAHFISLFSAPILLNAAQNGLTALVVQYRTKNSNRGILQSC
jgi:hypothetical protein